MPCEAEQVLGPPGGPEKQREGDPPRPTTLGVGLAAPHDPGDDRDLEVDRPCQACDRRRPGAEAPTTSRSLSHPGRPPRSQCCASSSPNDRAVRPWAPLTQPGAANNSSSQTGAHHDPAALYTWPNECSSSDSRPPPVSLIGCTDQRLKLPPVRRRIPDGRHHAALPSTRNCPRRAMHQGCQ